MRQRLASMVLQYHSRALTELFNFLENYATIDFAITIRSETRYI